MGSLESRGRQPLRAGRGQAHTDLEPTYHGTPAGPAGSRPDVGAGSAAMAPNITKNNCLTPLLAGLNLAREAVRSAQFFHAFQVPKRRASSFHIRDQAIDRAGPLPFVLAQHWSGVGASPAFSSSSSQ